MSQDFGYADGLQQLCTMLRLDAQELGVFTQPIPMPGRAGIGLVPQRYLGRGSFATAYAATTPDNERTVVIKLFRSDAVGAAALNREEKTLEALCKDNIKGITKLVGSVAYPPPPAAAAPAAAGLAAAAVPQLLYPTVLVLEPEGVTVERVVRDWQRDTQYRFTRALSCCLLLCATLSWLTFCSAFQMMRYASSWT